MKKSAVAVAVGAALGGVAAQAAIVGVELTSGVAGSMGAPSGLILSNSTATWTYDTVTGVVTGSGDLVQQSQVAPTIPGQVFTRTVGDLSFGGGINATGSSFDCVDGSFSNAVFASFCGNYNFGGNYANESSISYGPGLAFSRTVGGDDVELGAQQSISEYDGSTTTENGLNIGDTIVISNITAAVTAGQALTFTVVPVPAAAWLFGSALGLLGWARRRAAK
ncbi:MAG: VPLPA-CTERM sorting domain-containing protein [Gammaproteobacteria bacterium]